jgi:hypothetical protein
MKMVYFQSNDTRSVREGIDESSPYGAVLEWCSGTLPGV